MTLRYVDGTNGNDSYDGSVPVYTSGTTGPKKTIASAEAIPVAAGDIVHIKAGVYRESVTLGVSGTAGNPIEYRGDYLGLIWPGSGGVVRMTGSNDEKTATRANCILGTGRSYRTITNISFDLCTSNIIDFGAGAASNWIIQKCTFVQANNGGCISFSSTGNTSCLVDRCFFRAHAANFAIAFVGAADNTGNLVTNCIFIGGARHVQTNGMGGVIVRNCINIGSLGAAYRVVTALTVGQTFTVNNCIINGCTTGFQCTTAAEGVENYNSLSSNVTDRTTWPAGANSNTWPPLFDSRWFFQMVNAGAGPYSALQLVTPFDLSQYSQLIDLAGTSPTTTDMRGTAVQGAQREWGALEYDSTLKIFGGIHKNRLEQER